MAAILRILFGLASVLLMLGGIGIIIFSPIYGIKLSGVPCFFAGLTLFPPVIQTLNERFMPDSKLAVSYVLALLLAFILLATCFLVVDKANVERGYQTETQPREFEFGSQDLVVDQSVGDQALPDLSDDEWAALYDEARQKPEIPYVRFLDAKSHISALMNDENPTLYSEEGMFACKTPPDGLLRWLRESNWSGFKQLLNSGECFEVPEGLLLTDIGTPSDGSVMIRIPALPQSNIFWMPITDQPGFDEPIEVWQIQ